MANYLNLTTKSSNLKHRLPKLKGQIPYTRTITNNDTTLFDYNSGETVFLAITGDTDVNITLPAPRLGLNFTFINTLTPSGTGDAVIASAGGNDTIVVQSVQGTAAANVAATATVTFSGSIAYGTTITIIDYAGLSKTYTASAANDYANNEFDVDNGFDDKGIALKGAIEHESGHNGTITVAGAFDSGDYVLTLTQGLAGVDGNTTITENMGNTTKTDFTGGVAGFNLLADNVTIEAASKGGEWIEFVSDANFWYSRVTKSDTTAVSMNG